MLCESGEGDAALGEEEMVEMLARLLWTLETLLPAGWRLSLPTGGTVSVGYACSCSAGHHPFKGILRTETLLPKTYVIHSKLAKKKGLETNFM